MLKKKELLEFIAARLATLQAYVSNVNSIHLFDVNVVAEDFFAALLNEVYGYSLVNLNHSDLNKAAIDLGDVAKRVAVQVTSERTKSKLQKTVNKFVEHGLDAEYDKLRIVIIGDRTGDYATLDVPLGISFSGKNDVVDIAGLMKDMNRLDVPTLDRIADVIRRDLAEQTTTRGNEMESLQTFQAGQDSFCIATHIGTVEVVSTANCERHGRPVTPTWLSSDPSQMCSEWIVERLISNADLQLYFDPKWCGGIWFVADLQSGDGVVVNLDQLADLMPRSPTTTTTTTTTTTHDPKPSDFL